MLPFLREQAKNVNWVERRWARDGKIWTSGALLNGLDLMRAFVQETWGGEGAGKVASVLLELGHFPVRDVEYEDAPSKV